ncbi:metallophosphoesterase family protein [Domibacillus mangrovi]|uniref:Metallophosphatase family protein n=1 Tax=Domibacillus mangrovi TaxID=1714354 RepID=A0A1Q5P5Y0_9BACI|nr:metallophosphoesterase family protein [Domibacillus mangrovi]OKL37502.1 metallophosphatase family protein [Domibacillus mangrovi]
MEYALLGDLHSSIDDTKAVLAHIALTAPTAKVIGLGDLFECKIGKRKANTLRLSRIEETAVWSETFESLLTFSSVRGNQEERIMMVTSGNQFKHLPEHIIIDGAMLMHGHQWEWTKEWTPVLPKTEPPLLFFGHSHEAGLYRKGKRLPFSYGVPVYLKVKRYGINAGAVFGTREWVLYDAVTRAVTFMKTD